MAKRLYIDVINNGEIINFYAKNNKM